MANSTSSYVCALCKASGSIQHARHLSNVNPSSGSGATAAGKRAKPHMCSDLGSTDAPQARATPIPNGHGRFLQPYTLH